MIDLYEKGSKKFKWWQDWRGECVAIIGGGPTAKEVGVEKLRDRIHCVVINESYKLCPWAEVLYSCDAEWWKLRKKEVKTFDGIKLTNEYTSSISDMGLNKITIAVNLKTHRQEYINDFIFDEPGVIGAGMNSGFQTINITAQFGATGIMLVGFDMNMVRGVHWHGMHPHPLRNPDADRFKEWPNVMDKSAPRLAAHGIEVVNCSPISSLRSFEKFTLDEALERWSL